MTPAPVMLGLMCLGQMGLLPHLDSLADALRGPARLAVAADDSVFVCDPLNRQILRFDSLGRLDQSWPVPDGPVGIGVHPDGRFFVSLRDQPKVAVFDGGFQFQEYLGANEPMVSFVSPTDIDIAADTGRIYVVDADADRIYGFESDGELALMLGTRGSGPSQFLYPSAITVDEARGRLLVTDHDNFRVQVFTTSGVFLHQFGDRLVSNGSGTEGWMPRPAGLTVDSIGRVYLTDALMSTVRLFSPVGEDLGKLVEYGEDPGDVRVPCDVALSNAETRLYVASINSSRVEVYDLGSGAPEAPPRSPGPIETDRSESRRPGRVGVRDSAQGLGAWDAPRLAKIGSATYAVLGGSGPIYPMESHWDGPHIVPDRPNICWPCHGITGQPGGHGGTVAGQTALCMSCHNAGGRALRFALHERDLADPYETNPAAADGRGTGHAWGVAAINPSADSIGPAPGSTMASYLDSQGRMKCSTCHNQHNTDNGQAYLRVSNEGDAMCKHCHAARDQGIGEGGSHAVGIAYPAGDGEYPAESDLDPLFIKEGKVECMTCHAPHNADSGGANDGDGDGMLLRTVNDETLCRTCHTQHVNHDAVGDWQPVCRDCHDIHDPASGNVALVAREVNGLPVSFVEDGASCNQLGDFIHATCDPPTFDGLCEVCHTTTDYHRNSPAADHTHHTGIRCTVCHPHATGFLSDATVCANCHTEPPSGDAFPNTRGSHAVHFTGANGPGITECTECHASEDGPTHMNGVPSFASGVDANLDGNIDLAEADVCDLCHSKGGPLDGVNDPIVGAKANWASGVYDGDVLQPGKKDWCAGCHDTPGAVVHEVTAPTIAGDNVTWGFNLAGHGRNDVVCTDCHDVTLPHTDGVAKTFSLRFPLAPGGYPHEPFSERELDREWYNRGYRLRGFDGHRALSVPRDSTAYSAADHRLCFECHDEIKLLGVPANYDYPTPPPPHLQLPAGVAQTNYRNESEWGNGWTGAPANIHWQHCGFGGAIWDVDQDGFYQDSAATCVTCHNPHGAQNAQGLPTIALTAGDLELTHDVYDDGTTQQAYGFIGSGEFLSPGGDIYCFSCHPFFGAGPDPPLFEQHTRFYREWLELP